VLAVNMAVFVGYSVRGVRGALVAALAVILPSFVIMLVLAMGLARFGSNEWAARIMRGVRPAVVALIASPVVATARAAGVTYRTVAIPIVTALVVWGFSLSPIYVIVAAAAVGVLMMNLNHNRNKNS
jgi:chromate transporter